MPDKKKTSSKAKSKSKKGNNLEKPLKEHGEGGIREEILSILLFTLAVFIYVSISKFQGLPEDIRFVGLLGKYIAKGLEVVLGQGAVIFAFYLLLWSIHIGVLKKIWSHRMWGGSLLAFTVLLCISLYDIPTGLNALEAGLHGLGGGYLGGSLAYVLVKLVGQVGAVIFLVLSLLVSAVLIIGKSVGEIANYIIGISKKGYSWLAKIIFYETEEDDLLAKDNRQPDTVIINSSAKPVSVPEVIAAGLDKMQQEITNPPVVELPQSRSQDIKKEINRPAGKGSDSEYEKPGLGLLSNISSERTIDKKNIKESISILEDTFSSFGIKVKVNQVSCGPAVTRYELTPAKGVKISKIISLTDDLQLNLAAPGIRIEAPIPGKSAIGIEVPNEKILSVGLRNLISSSAFNKLGSPLAFALGEDITGNVVVSTLNDMPHLLIAGSTGSGKSVCLNCIIMSLLYNALPDELKLVFIDPKMVELTVYNGIPHLLTPVVTNPKKASVVLRWMVTEMEKRYKAFAEAGVRDIRRYNETADEKFPYIVIVIDELADLMMVAPVEVEDSICRLAQMARAAGMHLIVATQRPSVDVVTGIIKANIPSRIAFAVSSQTDSRTILDMGGAEKLLGKGDMLFFPVGAVKPYRIQGAYVSDKDIEATVEFIKAQSSNSENIQPMNEIEISMEKVDEDYGDELFWDAVNVFVDSKKASVSLLQRRLRVGYARAARLVDIMEDRGIVSELDSNKRREILIDKDQLERLQAGNKL
ncbi:MAG: DNA translocase FtsK 4TM domain-containing protein [Syntrophomonadaceae bacterium]|nr:DNA translocase FtsK 4TM domain-containing protein [Syntrophomonadaceae bacterium]MDD3888305.1 DNA translocase FtsK 4TM domain-containing protein [Syntrophomonadaceae bacterium]